MADSIEDHNLHVQNIRDANTHDNNCYEMTIEDLRCQFTRVYEQLRVKIADVLSRDVKIMTNSYKINELEKHVGDQKEIIDKYQLDLDESNKRVEEYLTSTNRYQEEIKKLQADYNSIVKFATLNKNQSSSDTQSKKTKAEYNRLKTILRNRNLELKKSQSIISQLQ